MKLLPLISFLLVFLFVSPVSALGPYECRHTPSWKCFSLADYQFAECKKRNPGMCSESYRSDILRCIKACCSSRHAPPGCPVEGWPRD